MQYINKLFYNLGDISNREAKLKERLNYDSVIFPRLQIKPISQSKIYELYYIPTMKTIDLISNISKSDIILMRLYDNLPNMAQKSFLVDILSSELHNTNLLEGVRSNKGEIVFTAKKALNPKLESQEFLRFFNAINSYIELKAGNLTRPKNAEDIRKIYDEITIDGVEKGNLPDGKLFRKKAAYIYTSKLEEVHCGITLLSETEEYIILEINKLLNFLNRDAKCNELIKNAIFHYYFGYIHPFYDGNGRTVRFISSIYIKEDYSWLTALSLSQGSNDNRSLYLKAFDSTNQVSMQGELNFFVDSFLKILNNGQNILKDNLQTKVILLDEALNKIGNDSNIKEDRDLTNIMKAAVELHLFGPHNDYIDVELLKNENILRYTDQTIRKKLNKLFELQLLNKISKNPVRCILNPDYLEQ